MSTLTSMAGARPPRRWAPRGENHRPRGPCLRCCGRGRCPEVSSRRRRRPRAFPGGRRGGVPVATPGGLAQMAADTPLTTAPKHGPDTFLFSRPASDLEHLDADIAFLGIPYG